MLSGDVTSSNMKNLCKKDDSVTFVVKTNKPVETCYIDFVNGDYVDYDDMVSVNNHTLTQEVGVDH
ncbi:hypothetical protein FACS189459_6780 [Bacilli bacterium]|nr:hypothetical protein FACS189459_6780 [Bacilli bacterium]